MRFSEKYRPPLEEYEVLDMLIYQAAEKTDTAVLVIGRNSGGEECEQAPYGRLLSDRNRRKAGERGVYTFRKRGGRPQRKRPYPSVVDREISGIKCLIFWGSRRKKGLPHWRKY